MKINILLAIVIFIMTFIFHPIAKSASSLAGNLSVDDSFEVYISTDDAAQGTLIATGNNYQTVYSIAGALTPGQNYYLHIKAANADVIAGFIGEFDISGSDHVFSNGNTNLKTNSTDWFVSKTGWGNYVAASSYGTNVAGPRTYRNGISDSAEWIWSSDDEADNLTYFSTRIIAANPAPLVHFSFEEESWSGTSDEILDSSGNGHHGRVHRNSTPSILSPAISGNPGTCGYASQNDGGIQVTGLPLDTTTVGAKTTVTFWMYWKGGGGMMPIGWEKYDIYFSGGGMGFNTSNSDLYGISSAGLANSWHHVAVEFTNGDVLSNRIYIDGVEQVLTQRMGTPVNSFAYVDSELRIGGWSLDNGYGFDGFIDEVQVHEEALTAAQVNSIMNQEHRCPLRPVADYRFDESSWDGTANEVADDSGNEHHGISVGMSTTENGKICNAGDFTATGTSDYLSLANTAITGLTDFTISIWALTDVINSAAILSGANANVSGGNEVLLFYSNDNTFNPFLMGSNASMSSGGISDESWHHIVWTRSGTNQCYYVDGILVDCKVISNSGPIVVDPGGLVIGQEQDQVGGGFSSVQAWDGLLDELIIFDSAIQDSEVADIYLNQNLGKNYDGSTRVCPGSAVPLLEYRFEEASWNGSADEIIDHSGNGHHGKVLSNSSPLTASPALSGNPGTCGYASQNSGAIQVTGLPLDTTTLGVKTTVTFWMYWDGTEYIMPLGWNLHDIYITNNALGFNTAGGDLYGISNEGLANSWHHVAVEFTNGNLTNNRIYIDGEQKILSQRLGSPNDSRSYVNSEMRIGGWVNNTGYNFHGFIDELRVYEGALTTAQVNYIMAERHTCPVTIPHHYEIEHDGNALTCEAESVTIKACEDENCTSLSTQAVSLDFLGDGTLISSETFTGSTTLSFNNTEAETVTLSIANESIAAISPFECDDSSSSSCDIIFSDAGFKFLYGTNNNSAIGNQIAGTEFADSLQIQAVKSNNGVCEGLFSGSTTIAMSQENIDPSGVSGLSFSANGNNIAKHPSASNISLTFDAESIATITAPVYRDAGKIRLHASYNSGGIAVVGNSNAFWVSPAQLTLSATSGATTLNGDTAVSAITHEAGENFTLSVSALNSLGDITPNYSPGQLQLALKRTGPLLADSVDGTFRYANGLSLSSNSNPSFESVTLSDFSEGVSTFDSAYYSEVGLLNLDIQDNDYGNQGIIVSAAAQNIGRFIPHHFEQSIAQDGLFQATCGSAISFLAYSGQKDQETNSKGAISYLSKPVLEISAFNKQGDITQNYYEDSQGSINDFMKLSDNAVSIVTPSFDEVATGVNGDKLPIVAEMNLGTLSQNDLTALPSVVALPKGVLHYELSSDDNFYYVRSPNALVQPFTSDIDFAVSSILDSDNVSATTTNSASPTGLDIYFGRLFLNNSFAPETQDLAQKFQVEYFNGNGFGISSNDNCLAYDANDMSLTNISLDPSYSAIVGGTGRFNAGKSEAIFLQAPGIGNQGEIGVFYEAYDWLKYDWDNDGAFDDSPSATASFGNYRGDDKLLHWRENL